MCKIILLSYSSACLICIEVSILCLRNQSKSKSMRTMIHLSNRKSMLTTCSLSLREYFYSNTRLKHYAPHSISCLLQRQVNQSQHYTVITQSISFLQPVRYSSLATTTKRKRALYCLDGSKKKENRDLSYFFTIVTTIFRCFTPLLCVYGSCV